MAENFKITRAFQEAAQALRESAKAHKKTSAFHRQAARECMESFRKLQEAVIPLGIELNIKPQGEGEHHGRQ